MTSNLFAPLILLVEDDEAVREAVTMVLNLDGFRVDAVCSVAEASARLAGEPVFDAVITDWNLPDGFGLDIAWSISAQQPGRTRLPVVLMTANKLCEPDLRSLPSSIQ